MSTEHTTPATDCRPAAEILVAIEAKRQAIGDLARSQILMADATREDDACAFAAIARAIQAEVEDLCEQEGELKRTLATAEADPAPTPFTRGVDRRSEMIHIKNHLTTAGIACAGLHSEDGEAIACVLFDMIRRLDRLVDDQDTELNELVRAERKAAAVDDGNGEVDEAAGDVGGQNA